MRTLPAPAAITSGSALLARGELTFRAREAEVRPAVDLFGTSFSEMQALRWKELAIVFQSAMNALNPVAPLAEQIIDTILAHERTTRENALARVDELLDRLELPRRVASAYPHQLSGGMRQRAVIAIALCLRPRVLILDEPTTALDVITQKSILQRLTTLRQEFRFSILFITHDLPLLFEFADRVLVLYAGRLAELGPVAELQARPRHPYTEALVAAIPRLGSEGPLRSIPGQPPALRALPSGCRFHPRCERRSAECERVAPAPTRQELGEVACHHPLP
jgi:peptide/nickel transport system ATP-binding protein